MIAAFVSKSHHLVIGEAPQPEPGAGEVLIRVHAAGVTTGELDWYPSTHTQNGAPRVSTIPSHEFSGVIESVGPGVDAAEIGREVFGMNDWFSSGALAEYCVAPLTSVAATPSRMTHEEAASVPIAALTAWQGLVDRMKVHDGDRVLVHAGAGSVGLFAIQIARLYGAHVFSTASPSNREFVEQLGAEMVIDYHRTRFEDALRDLDAVFDTVGGDTFTRSLATLKPDGRIVTIVSSVGEIEDPRHKEAFFIVEPKRDQLAKVAKLIEAGSLRTVVDSVVPLSESPEVYAGKLKRRGPGKIVISIH